MTAARSDLMALANRAEEAFNAAYVKAGHGCAGTKAGIAAILSLLSGAGTKSDGGVEADTPSNETATDVMAHPSPMGTRSCVEKTIACGVAGVAPGPSDYSITEVLKSACGRRSG